MLLENRVAIVTGGAKGMGKAIALKFAEEGCDVVVRALHLEGAQKVAEEIKALGRKVPGDKSRYFQKRRSERHGGADD